MAPGGRRQLDGRPLRIDGEKGLDERGDVAHGNRHDLTLRAIGCVVSVGTDIIVWVYLSEAVCARPAPQPGDSVVGVFGVPLDARPDAYDPAAIDTCLQSRRDARVTAANVALSSHLVHEAPLGAWVHRREARRAQFRRRLHERRHVVLQ